jgi:hypothetical protein
VRNRNWVVALAAVGVAALCGSAVVGWQEWSTHDVESKSDDTVRAYLSSVTNGDYDSAYALLCTDETGTDRSSFEQAERTDPIRGFDVESSSEWSSFVDGHGRVYQVRVSRAMSSSLVEIPTQGGDPDPVCIQYRDIRDLDPSPSTAPLGVQVSGQPTPTFRWTAADATAA